MKKITTVGIALICLLIFQSIATSETDKGKKIPAVTLKNMDGKEVNTAKLSNDGNPMIISFWATWCKPCKLELSTIAENYEDWQDETGVKLIAVSIDDQRSTKSVKPYVNAAGWEYDVLLDVNSEFKRAMGVNIPPQTFLVDGTGNIVWSHTGFVPGNEHELHEELLKISGK